MTAIVATLPTGFRETTLFPGFAVSDKGEVLGFADSVGWLPLKAKLSSRENAAHRLGVPSGECLRVQHPLDRRRFLPVAACVLICFGGERSPGTLISHANGDRADCRICNLSWRPEKRVVLGRQPLHRLREEEYLGAYYAVVAGSSVKDAAKKFGLPYASVHRFVTSDCPKHGLQTLTLRRGRKGSLA